ncbi:MAG: hypothetical protein KatS3mg110_0406 [Pirellulaceae bacterium]|nr:MAG: hypothetical protein KatS3mg110_0406 [Pirellulaceae bacterium]
MKHLGCLLSVVIWLVWCYTLPGGRECWAADADAPGDVFGPDKVWTIELELAPQEYDRMQPMPPGAVPNGDAETEDAVRNVFGMEFKWARCRFRAESEMLDEVGVRYDGGFTYLVTAGSLKRPMVLAFDKYRRQTFHGLSGLQLHAMPLDPAMAREVFAGELMRRCGVVVPRAAFAEVFLTVPGRFHRWPLGLYTVTEDIRDDFFQRHWRSANGLRMRPWMVRQVDYLGEAWGPYVSRLRPEREATAAEQQRIIAFARLVHQASDEQFAEQIGAFVDVDALLGLLAAHALLSDLNTAFAVGGNYTLYLDNASGKFVFVPEELEFSCAAMLLFGSPDELMDLSLWKPYPDGNRLVERLLAVPSIRSKYLEKLRQLRQSVFTREQLLALLETIERATAPARRRMAAVPQALPGAGAAPAAPRPPDLRQFIEARLASVDRQLDRGHEGFLPRQPQFAGPPPNLRSGPAQPVDDQAARQLVRVPDQFEWTLFAAPPQVNYPVAVACDPSGAVYIAVDQQGSLGREPGGGKILRCVDRDSDGRVDEVTTYATVEHPRGLTYRNGKLWVMHPPVLSLFEDVDQDGVADRQEILVKGLTTDLLDQRGGDHTTNCVRMGIDGWLYIGVGDYGIQEAVGKDGRRISLRGGGVVRVRPDGTELEIFCTGLRNPFDLAIDPYLNIFTRDNTNDGGGWDVRVSLLKQYAHYGYPLLFTHFTEETMPPLGSYGNGGGSGALFLQEARWPVPYNNVLLSADWGRNQVYYHQLTSHGATFDINQQVFLEIPRPTGMDIDLTGCLYVASWYGGEASVYVGPNVGFVVRVVPRGWKQPPRPDFRSAPAEQLVRWLASDNAVVRLHAQGEILDRGFDEGVFSRLLELAASRNTPVAARVAAIFTAKQLAGIRSHPALVQLTDDPVVREFALRALTDRRTQLEGLHSELFVKFLEDPSQRVRAQAVISLARLGDVEAAPKIVPLTRRTESRPGDGTVPYQNLPDPGRVIPHLAVRALVELQAVRACLEAVTGPYADGALQALHYLHTAEAVEGLIAALRKNLPGDVRLKILTTLMRLYYQEAPYDGSWWGIRPDTSGPYYDPQEWSMTARIRQVLLNAVATAGSDEREELLRQLRRHGIELPGMDSEREAAATAQSEPAVVLAAIDPNNPDLIGNLPFEQVVQRALKAQGDPNRGAALFQRQSCTACHTTADGQRPKGPHLVEIGKRYRTEELIESIVRPSAKLAQGYETYQFVLADGRIIQGFVITEKARSVLVQQSDGRQVELNKSDIEEKRILTISSMPDNIAGNLTPEQLADLVSYLQSLQ